MTARAFKHLIHIFIKDFVPYYNAMRNLISRHFSTAKRTPRFLDLPFYSPLTLLGLLAIDGEDVSDVLTILFGRPFWNFNQGRHHNRFLRTTQLLSRTLISPGGFWKHSAEVFPHSNYRDCKRGFWNFMLQYYKYIISKIEVLKLQLRCTSQLFRGRFILYNVQPCSFTSTSDVPPAPRPAKSIVRSQTSPSRLYLWSPVCSCPEADVTAFRSRALLPQPSCWLLQ